GYHLRVRKRKQVCVRRGHLHQKSFGWSQRCWIAGLSSVTADDELIACDAMSTHVIPPERDILNGCEAARAVENLAQLIHRICGCAAKSTRHGPAKSQSAWPFEGSEVDQRGRKSALSVA